MFSPSLFLKPSIIASVPNTSRPPEKSNQPQNVQPSIASMHGTIPAGMSALEEYQLLGEAGYRNYVTSVEKALKNFEYTSEWADLISALGKLNKVLQNNKKYTIIPRRITISKRLSQCLHPALPSGVHTKALETYNIIFKNIGPERLSQELFIYTSGLFPLLGHAAMNVKPKLLELYEDHFLPLSDQLKPCLHGFLMGVLPGLEESTDHFQRVDRLLLNICNAVGASNFYGSLWICIQTNPSIRLPAICFIISHYNKRLTMEDQLHIIGTDIATMVRGLTGSLKDTSVLVQRSALDLLLLIFPLDNSQLVKEDLVLVITAAVTVVLRRDMSLNKRLFKWLLGPNPQHTQDYFVQHSKLLMLQALRLSLKDPSQYIGSNFNISGNPELWPYRLLISLLDKPEINNLLLNDILIDIIRTLYHSCQSKEDAAKKELVRSANLLFGTLDPHYLWAYFIELFICLDVEKMSFGIGVQQLGCPISSVLELSYLLEFLLEIVSLETFVETRTSHLSNLVSQLALCLEVNCLQLPATELSALLNLSSKLLNRVQPDFGQLSSHFLKFFIKFVRYRVLSNPDTSCLAYLKFADGPQCSNCKLPPKSVKVNPDPQAETYQDLCQLLVKLSSFPNNPSNQDQPQDGVSLPEWLELLILVACFVDHEPLYLASLTSLLDLIALSHSSVFNPLIGRAEMAQLTEHTQLFPLMVSKLWVSLDNPSRVKVELLQQVHNLASSGVHTEDVICLALKGTENQEQLPSLKKFCTFWHLSRGCLAKSPTSIRTFDRCLYFMLDCLNYEPGSQKIVAQDWIIHSIQRGDLARILEPIFLVLLHPDTSRVSVQRIRVHCPNILNNNTEINESKIYAISSVSGNVIYHVSEEYPSHIHGSNPEKKILALTSLIDNSDTTQVVTSNSMIHDFEMPMSYNGLSTFSTPPISLFINPFGSMQAFDGENQFEQKSPAVIDLSNARRFESLQQQSNNVNKKESEEKKNLSSEDIAKRILEDIFDTLFQVQKSKSQENLNQGPKDEENEVDEEGEEVEDDFQDLDSLQDRLDSFKKITIHHLHTYMLLYSQVFDSQKTLYMLSLLKSIIANCPRLALCTMATTSISNSLTERAHQLQVLLARHRKSVYGNNFHGEINAEATTAFRSNTFIEVTISLCLYFIRSFYPNLQQMKLTEEEVIGNRIVRLACIDLLLLLFTELVSIVKSTSKSFANYLKDLLSRCKVQKTLLYCLISNVQSFQPRPADSSYTFTETISEFNEKTTMSEKESNVTDFQDTFQIHLLKLIANLILLEDTILGQIPPETKTNIPLSSSKFHLTLELSCQPMLLSTVVTALNQQHKSSLHAHWLNLVISSLPFTGQSLTKIVVAVASQICHNLEFSIGIDDLNSLPADYLLTLIESLTTLTHYCLLESETPVLNTLSHPTAQSTSPPGYTQIMTNLFHAFTSSPRQKNTEYGSDSPLPIENILSARRQLLSHMPRILAALISVWSKLQHEDPTSKAIKSHLLSCICPVANNYGSNFMAAIAVVWYDSNPASSKVLTDVQKQLVELVLEIKIMPLENVIQAVRQVLKQPPPTSHHKKRVPLELSALQFFLAYLQNVSQLIESWPSLLALWRDGLQLTSVSPPVHFHLLAILNEFVQRSTLLEDKKDQKDLQDIAQKLIETCLSAAGASLEQTTWLWKNYSVRPGPQADPAENGDCISQGGNSVQALNVLAEFLAPVLDVVYVSEEKEKVVPLLTNIMNYVTPYLKDHSYNNVPSFRACSQLLASVSSYQYTRKAWKKDVFELFTESTFFHFDSNSLTFWRATIDHLMTHDKVTFREFLNKIVLSPSGSLNLFSSKDQEFEQRAQLLKRLAFIIFCSELDQYQKYMPDIQEKLSDSVRLGQGGPAVQAQVFLCFRVLLLRMSPHHITSLWPVLITEMVQVFLQIEHELCTGTEEFSPAWLQLYLAACKLLDVALTLPSDKLPQFQMYRWAFVKTAREVTSENKTSKENDFVPHMRRLAALIPEPLEGSAGLPPSPPYLTMTSIQSLADLYPFFNEMADPPPFTFNSTTLAKVETTLEHDFMEVLTGSTSNHT